MRRAFVGLLIGALLVGSTPAAGFAQQPGQGGGGLEPQATFKAGVEVVTVTASVRDQRGRVVQGLKVSDFDGPTGGLPIVVFGQVAPQVSSVTITCFGTPYEATVTRGVVTWVAPTAAIGPRDCALEASVSGGETYKTQL